MIVIATQAIPNHPSPKGKLTIELLKDDHEDKFFIYDSEALMAKDMSDHLEALKVFHNYTINALLNHLQG